MTMATLTDTTPNQAFNGLLTNKVGLVMGVAHKSSIAWASAKRFADAGMQLVFTYQGERLEKNVRELADTVENAMVLPCDVTDEAQLAALFETIKQEHGKLDMLMHSIAFAKKEDLAGEFLTVERDNFLLAQEVSAYSLVATARHARPLMQAAGGGSIITMTYIGSERIIKNYNVMGVAKASLEANVRYLAADLGPDNIRVNAISAGPIKTLAARGITGFSEILEYMETATPMKRNVTADEVAGTALYLASNQLSAGVTGEVIHVDAGFHAAGLL